MEEKDIFWESNWRIPRTTEEIEYKEAVYTATERLSCLIITGPVLYIINKVQINKEWLKAYKKEKNRVVIIANSDDKDAVLINT